MKKRCNFYINEENIQYLHEKGINTSQLADDLLSYYVELMKKSENEIILMRDELNNEINEKSIKLKLIDKRIIELADEVK